MTDRFAVAYSDDGKIIDFLSNSLLEPTPEEEVRQRFLRTLHFEYGYPKNLMRREAAIQSGSKELTDKAGNPIRADIVVYLDKAACDSKNQGKIHFVVECKAPTKTDGYGQLVSYIFNTSSEGGVWFNGSGEDDEIEYYRRFAKPKNDLRSWIGIPRHGESWDALGRRKKSDLLRPKDIRGLLRRCHNRLHGRGSDGEEEDLTMDMVRIILSKAIDEEKSSELPEFYCTPEEYQTKKGIENCAQRIASLFDEVKNLNADVFSEHEKITVGPRAIADVAVELQDYQLLSDLSAASDWDIMGHAYEQYTSTYMKRVRGQFFTNRLVIDLLVAMVDPKYSDTILDPAGGSGGFLTGAMRYVRHKILSGSGSTISKQRQLDRHRTRLFMVEISRRLVKVAKTAMILNGDGHTGMTAGDSLGDYDRFDKTIVAQADQRTPTIILTNPPFAGVGEGRITHDDVLRRFDCGHRWINEDGAYTMTSDLLSDGAPPEMLFFDRCIDWLAPGGKLGIVLPKSFLDTQTYRAARTVLFRECKLLAVINCHKNTFQPHTGVRTCLIVLEKKQEVDDDAGDYPIFMAISRRIGQDSEGVPIFKRDAQNNALDEIDHDLDEILESFKKLQEGTLLSSGYFFTVNRSDIDDLLRINPQMFLPHLNETLEQVEKIDGCDGWSVSALSQLEQGMKIFKGPRFKSENMIVEEVSATTEYYFTPSAILQEKSDSVKILDVSRANSKQLSTISAIRVKRGDIVITRSGSIGRVAFITHRYHDAIVSDDLIRVRIDDLDLRHYVFHFLQTRYAQEQMQRNEYGAIQQHLEPEHIRNLLVPVPSDWQEVRPIVDAVERSIALREELEATTEQVNKDIEDRISGLIGAALAEETPTGHN